MKLKITNRDGEEEYIEVDYLSFMKCTLLIQLGFVIIWLLIAICAVLTGMVYA
jgi:hypothetical protein